MKVISLFDGMSCGRIALERAGIPVTQYIASEIDKYAIQVSRSNWSDIMHLGDVRIVRQMAELGLFGHIDLLIGGSPCQGFSFAGKQLAFDDPRSALFFEYVHILRALQRRNPQIRFMLENVKMKKEHLAVITEMLGVQPVFINSALVSAQNRQRYYWCNWTVSQPADRGLLLRDIIQNDIEPDPESAGWHEWFEKNKEFQLRKGYTKILDEKDKAITMTARQYGSWNGNFVPVNISSSGRGNGVVENRWYQAEKSQTLTSMGYSKRSATLLSDGINYRKLTPVECERLQGVPDNYTAVVSNSQRYKMLGNGWQVDTVEHIFREMPR